MLAVSGGEFLQRHSESLHFVPHLRNSKSNIEKRRQNQLIYVAAIHLLSLGVALIGNSLINDGKEKRIKRRFASTNDLSEMTNLDTKNGLPEASSFCYDDPKCGPDAWQGVCLTGLEQSPIDIQTHAPLGLLGTEKRRSFQLNSKYKRKVLHHYFAQNNGHTVQFELTPHTDALMSDLRISGGGLGDSYKFAQLHFHWGETNEDGSEHTLNGHKFPMELHVVHYRSKYASFKEAMNSMHDRAAIAVMAVFFDVGPHENVYMRPIVESVTKLTFPGEVTGFEMDLNIAALYPNWAKSKFARYYGSLTTPSCDEIVVWSVFLDPVYISELQMNEFRQLRNSEMSNYNYRPLQPLNGRPVTFYRPSLLNFIF